ncbi:MAG: hypothetical protein II001_05265 [Bacteroidales bacterium]|jgi:hypothetical protein|nr:hypothetical protein [Bacteroidales bacterium]
MKRIFLTLVWICFCAGSLLFAQTPETPYTAPKDTVDEPLVVFRDRFIMDIYHTFWMGMPVEVDHMKFDPGINISAIWDFKIKKKPLAIGLGIGVSYYTQYSNSLLQYDKVDDMMKYYVLPENVKYNHICMNYLSLNVPVEFRYRHPNGFKFTVGARGGWVGLINQYYKGDDPAVPSDTAMYKNLYVNHKKKFNIDFYARIGWKFVDVYYCYQVTPLFADAKGPKIRPMSLGISLSLF